MFLPFNSYSPLVNKERAVDIGGVRLINSEGQFYGCCTCIGSMGTALAALYGVMQDNEGYVINSYESAVLKLKAPSGASVIINEESNVLYGDGTVTFTFTMQQKEKLTLKLRIPSWSEKTVCSVDGKLYETVKGAYFKIEEYFENGSKIVVKLDNSFKLVRRNGKTLVKKGAYVLARDERYHDGFNDSVEIAVDKQGNVRAKTIKTGLFDTILEYEIATVDGKTIKMCDYGSAGKAWDSGIDTKLTAWL